LVSWPISLLFFLLSLAMLAGSALMLTIQPIIPFRTTAAAVLGPLAVIGLIVWGFALLAGLRAPRPKA
jgi:hypothetical protein